MITKTITDWLDRGMISSMMDPTIALVETIKVEDKLLSVAFVNGMPMPYETFSLFMLFRMAPRATGNIMMRQGVSQAKGANLPSCHVDRLLALVPNKSILPEPHRQYAEEKGLGYTAWLATTNLYDLAATGETSEALNRFRTMMARIDESYVSSLVDPREMSVEAFNLNNNRVVSDKLPDNRLDGLFKPIRSDNDFF